MEVLITPKEDHLEVKVVLLLSEADPPYGSVKLEAVEKLRGFQGTVEPIMDRQASRAIAARLVGRLVTKWKLNLIAQIDDAVVAALQSHHTTTSRGPEGGAEQ